MCEETWMTLYRPDEHCWKPVSHEQSVLLLAVTGTSIDHTAGLAGSSHGNPLQSTTDTSTQHAYNFTSISEPS